MTIDTAAAYRDAAKRIDTHGWVQDSWTGPRGTECLVQAIGRATGLTKIGDDTIDQVPKDVLAPLVQELGLVPAGSTGADFAEALWTWNDADGRTAKEVTALLRRVAGTLEAQTSGVKVPRTWFGRRRHASAPATTVSSNQKELTSVG